MKLASFYNLKFTKMYINLESMLFDSWTLLQICLFLFIRVEGVVKPMKHSMRGASYKSLRTPVLDQRPY
jgi:hypothetical protein